MSVHRHRMILLHMCTLVLEAIARDISRMECHISSFDLGLRKLGHRGLESFLVAVARDRVNDVILSLRSGFNF